MTDRPPESLEELVARRIVEQLDEGRLNDLLNLLNAGPQARAQPQLSGEGQLRARVEGIEGQLGATLARAEMASSGEVNVNVAGEAAAEGSASGAYGWTGSASGVSEMTAAIESISPKLARDLRSRSPQDINLAINFFTAIMQILQVLLMVYQTVHGEPPSPQQVIQIFNHTTNVINQTTMVAPIPPPSNPPPEPPRHR